MSEIKIARFVDIEACKSIFSEKSTFVLRSPEHYRRLYETTDGEKGDRNEGYAHTVDGGTAEFTGFVVSCWTKIKGTEPTTDEWDIFKGNEQNIVAIISTPSKVSEFLDKVLETNKEREDRRFPFWPVEHKEVDYDPPNNINHTNITDVVPFVKDKKFVNQKEYRFVLKYAQYPCMIDSYIFCGGVDYIEKCFVNPEISREENKKKKDELQQIIQRAGSGYWDFYNKRPNQIIANIDILF
ncbi:MAG: hypothetical protein JW947_10105 [Sedimentisphaerales bacterium]|nr:hypothetical protein [Sedimentisphaerales bacterium]